MNDSPEGPGVTTSPAIAQPRDTSGLAALVGGSLLTVVGVIFFDWDLLFVVFLSLLEVLVSTLGLYRTIVLHRRVTRDPAHAQPQFTGWLRMRFEDGHDFADGMAARAMPHVAAFLLLVTLAMAAEASAPLGAVLPLAASAILLGVVAYAETAPLRRRIVAVPFAALRARGIAMVYRTAAVEFLCIAGCAWHFGMAQPLREVVVGFVVLKCAVDVGLTLHGRRRFVGHA